MSNNWVIRLKDPPLPGKRGDYVFVRNMHGGKISWRTAKIFDFSRSPHGKRIYTVEFLNGKIGLISPHRILLK